MGQLEEVVKMFRNNIFKTPKDQDFVATPKQLSEYLESELKVDSEENTMKLVIEKSYGGDVVQFSKDIYHAQQIVLEFMDKGMKGLLTGDFSVFALKVIQQSIEKYHPQLQTLQKEFDALVSHADSRMEFFQ